MKTHIKYKNKPLCGVKKRKRKLLFVEDTACEVPTCKNCIRAAKK